MDNPIPEALFANIHRLMPIVCIDVVVWADNKILLVRRKKAPADGEWWFPGGRLLRGESVGRAASRVVLGEVGINISLPTFLSFAETQFTEDPFGHGAGTHTVNFVFSARVKAFDAMRLQLDNNHSEASFLTPAEIYEGRFDPYIKRFTAMAEGVIEWGR